MEPSGKFATATLRNPVRNFLIKEEFNAVIILLLNQGNDNN